MNPKWADAEKSKFKSPTRLEHRGSKAAVLCKLPGTGSIVASLTARMSMIRLFEIASRLRVSYPVEVHTLSRKDLSLRPPLGYVFCTPETSVFAQAKSDARWPALSKSRTLNIFESTLQFKKPT